MQYLEFIDLNYINLFIVFILLLFLILYNKKIKNESIKFRFLLIFLRFFTISVLVLLLFNPVLLKEELDNRMKISFLIDNSKSIDNWKDIVDIKNSISNFENNNLSNIKFDYYLFGDSLRKIENLSSINYSDNTTNYYSLFSQINKINSDEFILLSDGIQTSGFYYNKNWNNNKIINTWGIGEKISAQDIAIKDVVIDTAYKDSLFITLKVNSILNASREINIYLKNKIIEKKISSFVVPPGEFISKYKLQLLKKDLLKNNFIKVLPNFTENNTNNNYYNLVLEDEFLDSVNVILLSGSLSTNTKVIKNLINDKNISINHYYKISKSQWNRDIMNIDFQKYNLIVLDNFPLTYDDHEFSKQHKIFTNYKTIYFLGHLEKEYQSTVNNFLDKFGYKVIIANKKDKYTITTSGINNNPNISDILKKIPEYKTNISVESENIGNNAIVYSDNKICFDYNADNLFIFLPDLFSTSHKSINIYNKDLYGDVIKYYINKLKNQHDIEIYASKYLFDVNEDCKIYYNSNINNIKNLYLTVLNNKTNLSTKYNNSILKNGVYGTKIDISDDSEYIIKLFLESESGLKLESNILEIKSDLKSSEIANIDYNEDLLRSIAYDSKGKYIHINNINKFLNSYTVNEKNKIIRNRYNVFTLHNYWLIIIISLLLEWIIRKNRGLL